MADFCTKCAFEMWGKELPADIDIKEIAKTLKPDTYQSVICEGCGMRAVGKDKDGNILIAIPVNDEALETKVTWLSLEEWEKQYTGLKIPADES